MTLKAAIIADDLTGALDTATPFALCGASVAVAVGPESLGEALRSGAEVVAVSTASRALAAAEAARRIKAVAAQLLDAGPGIVFKKIDSRLQGNVAAEIAALASVIGGRRVVVAPAVPDQQRFTQGGSVVGRGIDTPLSIAPFLIGTGAEIADASSDADLDAIVAAHDWSATIAVGARGLGAAFARRFGSRRSIAFVPDDRTLLAIGSRDPLTEEQVSELLDAYPGIAAVAAPHGNLGDILPTALPALLHCTGPYAGPDEITSVRFAAGAARIVVELQPATLVMSGGDTALAVLDRLGVGVVFPRGEAAPGLPWFVIEAGAMGSIRCVVKSGGFGDRDVLSTLVAGAIRAERRQA